MILPAVRAFLLVEATVGYTFYYWSEAEVVQAKIIVQSAYTSVIEWSLFKWNGRNCKVSTCDAIWFDYFHVTVLWNLIGTANILAAEVTAWTRVSCRVFFLRPENEANLPRTLLEVTTQSSHDTIYWSGHRIGNMFQLGISNTIGRNAVTTQQLWDHLSSQTLCSLCS